MGAAQLRYESQLRKVARLIARLTARANPAELADILRRYADALAPWARRTAWQMLVDVDIASFRTWQQLSEEISFGLQSEVARAPIKARLAELLEIQVEGIKSIPLKAAERVEKLALQAVTEGTRAKEIAEEIARSGEVSSAHATMLARTSVSGAATALVQTRAQAAGSVAYVWETARDQDVRPSHQLMQGKVVRWDDPPVIDGYAAHAGQFANCRCWPRPILSLE